MSLFLSDIYPYVCFFFIYAFFGWVIEVIYHVVRDGAFVNRGFLNGPICPIYGYGMVLVVLFLWPIRDNPFMVFAGALIFASLLELFGGFALFKLFKIRWWDYSGEKFNIGGYVCPKFSLIWGAGGFLIIKLVHPLIQGIVEVLPYGLTWALLSGFILIMAADFAVTLRTVLGIRSEIIELERITKRMREFSDALGQEISDETLAAMERNEKIREKIEENEKAAKERREKLREDFRKKRQEKEAALERRKAEIENRIHQRRDYLKKHRITLEKDRKNG